MGSVVSHGCCTPVKTHARVVGLACETLCKCEGELDSSRLDTEHCAVAELWDTGERPVGEPPKPAMYIGEYMYIYT